MIKLNAVDATTTSMMLTFGTSQPLETDPELFKEFLEQFFESEQSEEMIKEIPTEHTLSEKEVSPKTDNLLAYANQFLFSFIPSKEETRSVAFEENQEMISIVEPLDLKKDIVVEVLDVNKETESLEILFSKFSKETKLYPTEIIYEEKDSTKNSTLKNQTILAESVPLASLLSDFFKQTEPHPAEMIYEEKDSTKNLTLKNESLIIKSEKEFVRDKQVPSSFQVQAQEMEMPEVRLQSEYVKTSLMEPEKSVNITSELIVNQPVLIRPFEAQPILKEQPVLSKGSIMNVQPERFVQDIGETIQVSMKNASEAINQVIQVKLSPESLGELEIHLEWQDKHVEAKIFVQEKSVKDLLETQFHQLQQLISKESTIQSFSIVLMSQEAISYQLSQDLGQRKSMLQTSKVSKAQQKREKKEIPKSSPYKLSHGLSLYI